MSQVWGGVGKAVLKFWTLLITCGALNGDYKVFGNRDLAIMKDCHWKIVAFNLENIVCKEDA